MANYRNFDDLSPDGDEPEEARADAGADILFGALSGSGHCGEDDIVNGLLFCADINQRQAFPEWCDEVYIGQNPAAIHVAAQFSDVTAVNLLIEGGADVNLRDGLGLTPLHIAIYKDKPDVAEALLKAGADPNAVFSGRDDGVYDGTEPGPLHLAACHATPPMVRLLAKFNVVAGTKDGEGETALHLAVSGGKIALAQALIMAGAPVNVVNGAGETPLHLLFGEKYIAHGEGLARLLIKSGADIDGIRNARGKTVRDLVIAEENEKLLDFIAQKTGINQALSRSVTESNLDRLDRVLPRSRPRRGRS